MRHTFLLLLTCLCLVGGTTSHADTLPPSAKDIETARTLFLLTDGLPERLSRLLELEQQALALSADQPLKLGSIGSAILDLYQGSQTGHFAMSRYYEEVEAEDARANHTHWLEALQAHMRDSGQGTAADPYLVMTIYDAHAYARSSDHEPVGSIYQSSEQTPFGFLLVSRPQQGKLRQLFFDISPILSAHASPGEDAPQSPWPIMRNLATEMDSAAQTAIGAYLTNIDKYEEATSWLRVAARSGNVLANTLLARIYWTQAEATEDEGKRDELRELSLENHLHAITMGSTDSMYTLANLYLADYYGEDNQSAAIPLLQQAADQDHIEAVIYLGHLYNTGQLVDENKDTANSYFLKAAQTQHHQGLLSYGRFLTANNEAVAADEQVTDWLEALTRGDAAESEQAEAMVVLGNLHARGIGTRASNRKSVRWYKRAARHPGADPDIINEIAWTLTVSDIDGLIRADYANRIMQDLMDGNNQAAQRPEYLDTWAATYAAMGDFERAVQVQQQAIEAAESQEREDVIPILMEHLELFQGGKPVFERAP